MPFTNSTLSPIGQSRVLFSLLGANMNSTADQILSKAFAFTSFTITSIVVTNASTSLTTAVGGIYTAAAKGGTAIVAAAQTYAALNTATKVLNPTIQAGGGDLLSIAAPYLSLTTAQGATATADIYVVGFAWS